MNNQVSDERLYEQWYRFIENQGFTWKGFLTRYEGNGNISELLTSTRKFTANQDTSQIEHYLCFINQEDTSKIVEKTFIIEKCGPGLIHPIDTTSMFMFSSSNSGLMSRALSKDGSNYAEIYLNVDNRRISVVIFYNNDDYTLSKISLFREVKHTANEFPWSKNKPEIISRNYPNLKIVSNTFFSSKIFEEIPLDNYPLNWSSDNRIIFDFPDGISINVPEILKIGQKDDLIVSWQYNDQQVKRGIAHFNNDNCFPDLITQDCLII